MHKFVWVDGDGVGVGVEWGFGGLNGRSEGQTNSI